MLLRGYFHWMWRVLKYLLIVLFLHIRLHKLMTISMYSIFFKIWLFFVINHCVDKSLVLIMLYYCRGFTNWFHVSTNLNSLNLHQFFSECEGEHFKFKVRWPQFNHVLSKLSDQPYLQCTLELFSLECLRCW